jgi:hypothetical protein
MTSSGMYRGVVTNGASASSPVHNSGTNLKSESTVKLYFDGTTDLIGDNTPFHVELNMVNDQREGLDDPRSMYWGYWYGSTIDSGHETLAFIPRSVSVVNKQFKKKNLWSTSTLRKMPRKID